MKLGKKNFWYSIALAAFILVFVVSYLAILLPNLYVDHSVSSTTEELEKSHFEILKNKKNIRKLNKVGNHFYLEMDREFNKIDIFSYTLTGSLDISKTSVKDNLTNVREILEKPADGKEGFSVSSDKFNEMAMNFEEIVNYFKDNFNIKGVGTDLNFIESFDFDKDNAYYDFKKLGDNTFSVKLGYRDSNVAEYITYIALTNESDGYKITFGSFIAPRIEDVLPVVLSSLPMIILVLMLLVLVISNLYSKKLVKPIIEIQRFTENAKSNNPVDYESIRFKGKDELSILGRNIIQMDKSLRNNLEKLKVESERKDVFTRSATHQLKTPLAASLLLCDGMINNMGKYQDRDKYLPILKGELLEMNKMVQELLSVRERTLEISPINYDVKDVISNEIEKYRLKSSDKNLKVSLVGKEKWFIDVDIFTQIIDNILENCVSYTKEDGFIKIEIFKDKIEFYNEESQIPHELENSILDPFVSSTESKSKGLGLYISKYYSDLLGLKLSVKNHNNGVLTTLRRTRDDKYK
ncbi:HAMP domain-containing sensor histidine kinase [Lagierella sp.]|uniref:sensor histidine kinase n=1 Tax=Lagierella sp. TaxID=2849657 RepID=UPI002618C599|nr:HAMP domain-containing sensor histidine kinase [Lagierella sp.]